MTLSLVLLEFLLKRVEIMAVGAGRVLDQWKGDRFVLNAVHTSRLPAQQRFHEK